MKHFVNHEIISEKLKRIFTVNDFITYRQKRIIYNFLYLRNNLFRSVVRIISITKVLLELLYMSHASFYGIIMKQLTFLDNAVICQVYHFVC